MRALHLCFWLHHPYELLGAGKWEKGYFGGENEFKKRAQVDYQPMMAILERNAQRYPSLRVSLVVSGVWLEQAERWEGELLQRLKRLVQNGNVELVITPYYYSMAGFYDLNELAEQVIKAQEKIGKIFNIQSAVLALPQLCYHNKFAQWAEKMGFKMMLAGDATETLEWRSANRVYEAKGCDGLKVLFWNRKLTEMITKAQDFATIQVEDEVKMDQLDPDQLEEDPKARKTVSAADFVRGLATVESVKVERTVEKKVTYRTIFSAKRYQKQLDLALLRGGLITLHLQPKIFSRWRDLGIIGFFDELLKIWLENPANHLVGVREILHLPPKAEISIKHTVSDTGETAKDYQLPEWWTSEENEQSKQLYQMRERVLKVDDKDLEVDFAGLTDMNYAEGGEQYEEILQDIERRLAGVTTETADGRQKVQHSELVESTAVKVKFGAKRDDSGKVQGDVQRAEKAKSKREEEKDPFERFKEAMANLADVEGGSFWDTENADEMDAALQVFAQRMKWQSNNEPPVNLDNLMEAELVLDDNMGFVETDLQMDEEEVYENTPEKKYHRSEQVSEQGYAMNEPREAIKTAKASRFGRKKGAKKISIS